MKTIAVNIKYSPVSGPNCSFMVERVSLLYLNSHLETERAEIVYLPSGASCLQNCGVDEVDCGSFTFKNIEFEQINRKIGQILKNAEIILYGNAVEKEFLQHFVSGGTNLVQIR
jgi:hypothetical protein